MTALQTQVTPVSFIVEPEKKVIPYRLKYIIFIYYGKLQCVNYMRYFQFAVNVKLMNSCSLYITFYTIWECKQSWH